ncbi:DUF6716 putative glycosyltransferase [Thermomonospora umbrina]|uniref:Glycosyltransferase involved in cell wall biosynthesis n=1 Tax=Thermomonospora umbrina TaxID=111806 RepID=A0A3D9SWH9_9ACTN|nr:DUF6716 putative glycosyltransferase [Thermomonospora umbrina]REE98383.1 hypothetical protein DFJ69_3870 [Thermomonospora umbrina]
MTVPARVLAVADSDSYLKWTAGLLDHLPEDWSRRLAVVRSPITPSPEQIRSALNGTGSKDPAVVTARGLVRVITEHRPDVVLLGCTGPVVDTLSAMVLGRSRPVLVSGLPGISVPATERAWRFRSAADLFIVHSHHEVAEFTEIARRMGLPGRVGLARLPFLAPAEAAPVRDRVVFATQAKVPVERGQRESILLSLAALAERRPDLRVVVKLRALATEEQTHRERHSYQTLWDEMVAEGRVRAGLLTFDAGPMREHLAHAAGFVTVSSTAALEAIAASVPLLVLSDFGVGAEMINLVFADSGCLGTLADLERAEFRDPDPAWCAANYFHAPDADDWVGTLTDLVRTSRGGALPVPTRLVRRKGLLAEPKARLRLQLSPTMVRQLSGIRRAVRR